MSLTSRKATAIKDVIYFPAQEGGYILVLTMCILVVLSFIGLSFSNLTNTELQIAGNDRLHKDTFYQADGGTELGMRLAFDNAMCIQVNGANNGFTANQGTSQRKFNNILANITFAEPHTIGAGTVSDTNRDVSYYPSGNISDTNPHTNLLYSVTQKAAAGQGQQMVSGYEGPVGVSQSTGVERDYVIYSQHKGDRNSESTITVGWKLNLKLINDATTSDCNTVYTN